MAIDVLNLKNPWVEGATQGLQNLAQHKMNQIQRNAELQRGSAALQGVGYGLEEANQLAPYAHLAIPARLQAQAKQEQMLLKHALEMQQQQAFEQSLYGNQGQGSFNPGNSQYGLPTQQYSSSAQPMAQQPQMYPAQQQNQFQPFAETQQQVQQPRIPLADQYTGKAPLSRAIPGGLKPQQYVQFSNHLASKQKQADATNAPFNKEFDKRLESAEKSIGYLDEAERLLNTGNVASGAKGRYSPWIALNEESRKFSDIGNLLAGELLKTTGGRGTKLLLDFIERQKINLNQLPEEQRFMLNLLRKQAQSIIDQDKIRQEILAANGGYQIPNMASAVSQVYKQQYGEKPPTEITDQDVKQIESSFNAVKKKAEENTESSIGKAARNIAGVAKAGLAGAAGIPGGLLSAGLGVGNYLTGGATPTYEQIQENLPVSFPTPEQNEKFIDDLTNGYTAPRNEFEQSLQNIASVVGSLVVGAGQQKVISTLAKVMSPTKAAAATRLILPFSGVPWKQALKIGAASEAGGRTAEFLGRGTGEQALARIAFGVLASAHGTAQQIEGSIADSYKAAEQAGERIKVNTAPIKQELRDYAKSIPRVAPYKNIADNFIEETIESLDRYGHAKEPVYRGKTPLNQQKINASDLVKTKQATNELYGLSIDPKEPGGKHLPKGARKYPAEISRIISRHIEPAALNHPEFGKPYAMAEDLFKAKNEGQRLGRWLEDIKESSRATFLSPIAKTLIDVIGNPFLASTAETYNYIWNHPVSRRYYLEAMKAGVQGNAPAFSKAFNQLKEFMERKEK